MAPKSKSKSKSKSKASQDDTSAGASSTKLKPANSINVRHILCEKHSNKEIALGRLRKGHKFDDVAKDLSEDKARQGMIESTLFLFFYSAMFYDWNDEEE
jgi:NIMA-interacting peptidyl-prolyl cis-trans isomerase 4